MKSSGRLLQRCLGLEAFDEALFLEQIDHIDVNAEMILTYVFKDGHTVERKWDTKRHMPKWSAERPGTV